MSPSSPALVMACSAASAADARCREAVTALVASVSQALPDVTVRPSTVGASSELKGLMARLTGPAVVLPLFAAATGSLLQEVTLCAALAPTPVRVARALGPHRLLARAMVSRLRQAGARWGDAVVLAAPSSACDALAMADTERAAGLLRSEWGPLVSVAAEHVDDSGNPGGAAPGIGGAVPGIGQAVHDWHEVGSSRIFVVPYVISSAPALSTLRITSLDAGATGVTDAPGPHRLVAELVVQRYQQSAHSLRQSDSYAA